MSILCTFKSLAAKVMNPIAGKSTPTAILVGGLALLAGAAGLVIGIGIAIANRFGVKV